MNRVLARDASEDEARILLDGLNRTTTQYNHAPQQADEFLRLGESTRDEELDPIVHASWTALCLAVLNNHEALNRE